MEHQQTEGIDFSAVLNPSGEVDSPLAYTKAVWIQMPSSTDKLWIDRRILDKVAHLFPNNSFPTQMGAMLMRYAAQRKIPLSASGRLMWKQATGMTKSKVAEMLLEELARQAGISS